MSALPGRAAFLDRDGTIIREAHYLHEPDRVELIAGAAEAVRTLERAGYAPVIVSNQSGIARGLYTEAQFCAVQRRLDELLAEAGARLSGVYHCPHHPDFTGSCECRKPALALYHRAATELDVDLASSIYVGDRLTDVLPALATGGRGFLVRTGYGAEQEAAAPQSIPHGIRVLPDLAAVARAVTADEGTLPVDTSTGRE